jgi:hypothetical protein
MCCSGGVFGINDRKSSHFDSPLHHFGVTSNIAISEVTELDAGTGRKIQ